jgi:hypothetical protein
MSAPALRLPVLVVLVASLAATGLVACGDDTGGAGGGGQGGDGQGGDGKGATGSTTGGDGGAGTTSGAGGDDASSTTGTGAGEACPWPEDDPSAPAPTAVTEVSGTVLTTDGDPVADSEVQVCGRDNCLYGDTNAEGAFVVNHDGSELDKPIVKAGDGLALAKLGFAFPTDGEPVEATVPVLADSGTAIAPGASADAGGVTLTVATDGEVALNLLDFGDPGEDTFRAAVVPADQVEAVAPGQGFAMIVGLGPHETRFCPAAALSVPNDAGLEPGAAVEVFLYGLQVGEAFVPYGEWEKIADATVSDDGTVITTNDGEGLPVLGPIGLRAAD